MSPEQHTLARIEHKLDRLIVLLSPKGKVMATFDALLAAVANETTVTQSAIVAFQGLAQRLANLQNSLPSLSTADAATLAAEVADINTNAANLAAAIQTNITPTTVAPATTQAPVATTSAPVATPAPATTQPPAATTSAPEATTAPPAATTSAPAQS